MIFLFKISFLEISWIDLIDVVLVTILLYQIYKMMHGSLAMNIFLGILFLYFIYLFVKATEMELLTTILGQFMGVGVLAMIVLFQPELRKFFMVIGRSTDINKDIFKSILLVGNQDFNVHQFIEAIKNLMSTKTGSLIVFSRDEELKFYVETGEFIDAPVKQSLLLSIFNKQSPLHDGAVIICEGRMKAAKCVLPVSENDSLPSKFGLRHRAAIGMSEITDTLVVAISEETGNLILARNGKFFKPLKIKTVEQKILEFLQKREPENWTETELEVAP